MNFKTLIIASLSFSSICTASMHDDKKYVNKAMSVNLDDIEFEADGMYYIKDASHRVRLSKLSNENNAYIAHFRIDYVCGKCYRVYKEKPEICEVCGSSDIREVEVDLWPIG